MENSFLEKKFRLKENGTTARTEFMAGLTTFMTMAYILAVNPSILSEAGMDFGAVFTATILASIIGCLIMGLYANYPFGLSAGMGLNAYFTYTVVIGMGYDYSFALTAVFLEGIIFILMSFFSVREQIFRAFPVALKNSVSVGIGLFITLIGLLNSGILVTDKGTALAAGSLTTPEALVTIFGIILVGFLSIKNVRGSLLIGILASTVLAIILGVTKLPTSIISAPPSIEPVFMSLEFDKIFTFDMVLVVFAFLFVDVFDTIGTLIGVSTKANMLDKDGDLPNLKQALLADAVATVAGSILGTSTVTTFVESAAGVAEGGKTGLTSVSVAFFFLLSLLFYPIFSIIPASATAPILIIVGLFMMEPITKIDFTDISEGLPAFLTIVMMPFGYSVAEGIVWGTVSYVVLKVITGKSKDLSPILVILAILFTAVKIFG